MKGAMSKWVGTKRKIMMEEFGNKCARCSSPLDLEFHHKKPTNLNGIGRGSYNRVMDVINFCDCYILLCKVCHRKLHQEQYMIKKEERRN